MKDFVVYMMLMGAVSGGDYLPFWATANQFGIYPEADGGVAQVSVKSEFDMTKDFHYRFGGSFAARGDRFLKDQPWNKALLVDELYGSVGWKCLTLDLGMKHPELDYYGPSKSLGSISSTGGHLIATGNARSQVGYNLILEKVAVPGTKGHWVLWGMFGDYIGTDNSYVKNRLYHRTKLFTKVYVDPKLQWYLTLGLDHYALWGGYWPDSGYGRVNFNNYVRMVLGMSAGSDGTGSDQANTIGDQGGAETLGFGYEGRDWTISFQHEIPYSDKSGMYFKNFPDGVNTFAFSFKDKNKWVSDIVYELYYTRYQSGSEHVEYFDDKGHIIPPKQGEAYRYIGVDNYFNNGEFRSGWTYYGRPLTSPLFYPSGTLSRTFDRYALNHQLYAKDYYKIQSIENNRIIAHHIGIAGKLGLKAPYKLMATISQNYGTYGVQYTGASAFQKPWGSVKESCLWQFSLGFMGEVPNLFKVKQLSATYGVYFDCGQVLECQSGITVGLKYLLYSR